MYLAHTNPPLMADQTHTFISFSFYSIVKLYGVNKSNLVLDRLVSIEQSDIAHAAMGNNTEQAHQ